MSAVLDVVLSGTCCILVISQMVAVFGTPSRTFMAKKSDQTDQDSPYNSISHTTLTFCDSFLKCAMDVKCSGFSMDTENKITRLYAMSTRASGDYVIWNDRCPFREGYIYSRRFNYCMYLMEREKKSWFDARSDCQSSGGDLLSLETDEKLAEVKQLLDKKPHSFWLGGRRVGSTFRWVHGEEEVVSAFWHPGEPSSIDHLGHVQSHITSGNGYMNSFGLDDDGAEKHFYFICEY